jgi:hypothetical protein
MGLGCAIWDANLCCLFVFRVAPGRLLHHNYANHYDMWNEDAKVSHIY